LKTLITKNEIYKFATKIKQKEIKINKRFKIHRLMVRLFNLKNITFNDFLPLFIEELKARPTFIDDLIDIRNEG